MINPIIIKLNYLYWGSNSWGKHAFGPDGLLYAVCYWFNISLVDTETNKIVKDMIYPMES